MSPASARLISLTIPLALFSTVEGSGRTESFARLDCLDPCRAGTPVLSEKGPVTRTLPSRVVDGRGRTGSPRRERRLQDSAAVGDRRKHPLHDTSAVPSAGRVSPVGVALGTVLASSPPLLLLAFLAPAALCLLVLLQRHVALLTCVLVSVRCENRA